MEAELDTEETCCLLSKGTNTAPHCVDFPGLFSSLDEQAAFRATTLSWVRSWCDNANVNMFLHEGFSITTSGNPCEGFLSSVFPHLPTLCNALLPASAEEAEHPPWAATNHSPGYLLELALVSYDLNTLNRELRQLRNSPCRPFCSLGCDRVAESWEWLSQLVCGTNTAGVSTGTPKFVIPWFGSPELIVAYSDQLACFFETVHWALIFWCQPLS